MIIDLKRRFRLLFLQTGSTHTHTHTHHLGLQGHIRRSHTGDYAAPLTLAGTHTQTHTIILAFKVCWFFRIYHDLFWKLCLKYIRVYFYLHLYICTAYACTVLTYFCSSFCHVFVCEDCNIIIHAVISYHYLYILYIRICTYLLTYLLHELPEVGFIFIFCLFSFLLCK